MEACDCRWLVRMVILTAEHLGGSVSERPRRLLGRNEDRPVTSASRRAEAVSLSESLYEAKGQKD